MRWKEGTPETFDRLAMLSTADALGMSPARVRAEFSARDMMEYHAFLSAREKVREEHRKQRAEESKMKRRRR